VGISSSTIKAKYDSGELLVTSHSPHLPSLTDVESWPLLAYLTFLSARDIEDWYEGWRAIQASFSGYEITLELESFEISQTAFFPIYFIQKNEISYPEKYAAQFIEKLKQPPRQAGWKELATSPKLVSHIGSVVVITLWTKEGYSAESLRNL